MAIKAHMHEVEVEASAGELQRGQRLLDRWPDVFATEICHP